MPKLLDTIKKFIVTCFLTSWTIKSFVDGRWLEYLWRGIALSQNGCCRKEKIPVDGFDLFLERLNRCKGTLDSVLLLCRCILPTLYISPVTFSICFVSTSIVFHSLLYASRLFHSFLFNALYIIFAHTARTEYFLDTPFSMMFTYVTYPFWECSLSLYKPDQFEIYLSVFWNTLFIVLPRFTKLLNRVQTCLVLSSC